MSQEKKKKTERRREGEGGRATHTKANFQKKKKSCLFLDRLELRNWRPGEVRVVCGEGEERAKKR
jgi:hypothetical protein